mmetsp:Transcript_75276/g.166301  ORF Transcript_75276/g.166301 Transcript_75276/m.166301 type:complete len:202 (-) Transcript_75276:125-730(-)
MERGRGKSHGLQNLRLSGRSDHGHQATHGVPCQRQAVLRQVPLNLPNQGVCLLGKVELTFILLTNLRRSPKHGPHVIGKRSPGLGFVEETPIHDALLLVPLHTDPLEGDHHRSADGFQEDPPKNATGLGIAIVVPQPLPASPTGLEGVELIQLCMVPGLGGVVDHVIGLHQNLHPLEKGARRLIRQNFAKIKEVTSLPDLE